MLTSRLSKVTDVIAMVADGMATWRWAYIEQVADAYNSLEKTLGQMVPWAFWTFWLSPQPDGHLNTTVYRKPTHTDLYLWWDSHHTISAKYSMVNTLHHRARAVSLSHQLLQKQEHLHKVLERSKYPSWAFNRINMKIRDPARNKNI